MPSKVAVVIPNHKEELNELEKISLAQCRTVLSKYPIIFALPAGKSFSYLEQDDNVVYFPPQCFQNVRAYNILMMSPFFYEAFKNFEYILIYELDAFVFYDALEDFCSLGYDYIGAPWPYYARRNFADVKNVRVGNSGFCLRNVKAHYDLLINNRDLFTKLMYMPNDDFYAYCGARKDVKFNVPPINVAACFSVEYLLEHSLKNIGGNLPLPFGCHGWTKMSADFFVKALQKFGYDLSPLRDKMDNLDYRILSDSLINYAFQRLNYRINRGQSLMRYLPRNHFASIRVVRSSFAMMIFARLMLENPNLADEVYFYDESEQDILIDNLILKKEPHLLIGSGRDLDEPLISAATNKGITYGNRVVSFMREYLNYCEKAFHNLGKS